MLDIYLPMMKAAALMTAGKLGLFEALVAGGRTAPALAAQMHASPAATEQLARFLVTQGYLHYHAGLYANTEQAQRWFTSAGTIDYSAGLHWTHAIWDLMGQLSDVVERGEPSQILWDRMVEQPQLGHTFSRYMRAFAHDLGPDLLTHVPVSDRYRKVLDLGGSHGLHAIRFCQRYPQLHASIVDFPQALGDTAARIAQEHLTHRIQLVPGNLLDHAWESGQDLVFLLSVAHNQSEADNQALLRRIRQTLNPGGMLVIHDYLADVSTVSSNAFYAAFALTLLLETGTGLYRHDQYTIWLQQAGFSQVSRVDLTPIEKGSLLLARA